jgi:hypothetical protein
VQYAASSWHDRGVSRRRRYLLIAGGFALALAIGLVVGVAIELRMREGQWKMPDVDDVIEVVTPPTPPPPPKVIVLEKRPVTLTPGTDDAAHGASGVVLARHPQGAVSMPGWKGSKSGWTKLIACVKKMFAPFDVAVVEERPPHDEYVLVAVGGRPKDLGLKDKHVTGLAPFNGEVIPRAVVFAFAGQVGHDVRTTCETIAMEVAHAYGLDHEYLCKDVMTYLGGCGAKSFVDKEAPCGEKKARACRGGLPTQNSYRRLMGILGPHLAAGSDVRPTGGD